MRAQERKLTLFFSFFFFFLFSTLSRNLKYGLSACIKRRYYLSSGLPAHPDRLGAARGRRPHSLHKSTRSLEFPARRRQPGHGHWLRVFLAGFWPARQSVLKGGTTTVAPAATHLFWLAATVLGGAARYGSVNQEATYIIAAKIENLRCSVAPSNADPAPTA